MNAMVGHERKFQTQYPGCEMPRFKSYPGSQLRSSWLNLAAVSARSVIDAGKSLDRSGIRIDGEFRALKPDDVPAIVVAHNERRLIGSFLDHYRRLGVTRFLWLDDHSVDGSPGYLASQPDVDLLVSNVRYREARRGRVWREMITDRYGRERWYLMVDADEFLIYKDCESVKLPDVIRSMTAKGVKHFFAPMIDLYPGGDVDAAVYSGGLMPWEVADSFDAEGYRVRPASKGWRVEGGVRQRIAKSPPLLTKYPLIYWDAKTNLNANIHFPGPYYRNLAPAFGVLLHFKFFADFRNSFRRIVESGSHFAGGTHYRALLKGLESLDSTQLETDASMKFEDSRQMHQLGFFSDWR
jgi:hypothetical protein